MGARRTGEGGLGLVGMLVVLAVLGALVVLAVSSLGGDEGPIGAAGPGTGLVPGGAAPGAVGGAGALVGASSVAACSADVAAIESALAAANATLGRFPATVPELVTSGFLSEAPDRPGFAFSVEMVAGSPTGRVLVNGRPADEGCATPSARDR